MAKEYLQSNGRLLMTSDGELVQVPDSENLNDLADTNSVMATQSETTSNEIEDLIVNGVIDGSPRGVYANLSALQTAYPSGASGVYLTSDNGHWYYWNGSAWSDGGVYQATEPSPEVTEAVENINKLLYGEIILDSVETANNAYRDSEDNLIATYYASKSALSQANKEIAKANKEIANLKEALYGYVLDSTDVEINSVIPYTTTIGSNTYNLVDNAYGLIKEIRGNTVKNETELNSVEYKGLVVKGANLLNIADKSSTTTNGVTYSIKDGVITLNGTCSEDFTLDLGMSTSLTDVMVGIFGNISGYVSIRTWNSSWGGDSSPIYSNNFKHLDNVYYIRLTIAIGQYNNTIIKPMLVKGSVAPTQFKPYHAPVTILPFSNITLRGINNAKDKIVITKNTDDEYYTATKIVNIGSVDLGSNVSIVSEWQSGDNGYWVMAIALPNCDKTNLANVIANCRIWTDQTSYWSQTFTGYLMCVSDSYSESGEIFIAYGGATTHEELISALAQNPISIQYKLATPTTEVLSSTLTDSDVMPLLELGGSIDIVGFNGEQGSTIIEMVYRLTNQ